MYYHEIETVLRLHEFGIHDRLLKCQITKIVITRIQYTFQWDFPCKTKVAMGDPCATLVRTCSIISFLNYYID